MTAEQVLPDVKTRSIGMRKRSSSIVKPETDVTNKTDDTKKQHSPCYSDSEVDDAKKGPVRLCKITCKKSWALDQIKFTYSDGTTWIAGSDKGKSAVYVAIMTPGEHLVRVSHEKFKNLSSAGAAVEFETNMGRVFAWKPKSRTGRKSETTTLRAAPGHEIISLDIRDGILHGIEEQLVPHDDKALRKVPVNSRVWYTLATKDPKEGDESGVTYEHFASKRKAINRMRAAVKHVQAKPGRSAVLFDTFKARVFWKEGENTEIKDIIDAASKEGYVCERDDKSSSLFGILGQMWKLFSGKNGVVKGWGVICNFVLTYLFLISASFFGMQTGILGSYILTAHHDRSQQAMQESFWVRTACKVGPVDCSGGDDFGVFKATLFAITILKFLERIFYVSNVWIHHRTAWRQNIQLMAKSAEHVFHLGMDFFETHDQSEIHRSMNPEQAMNLITWRFPYFALEIFRLVMIFVHLSSISVSIAVFLFVGNFLIRMIVIKPIEKRERILNKISRKRDTLRHQIVNESLSMIQTVKYFSKESQAISELQEADVVNQQCVNEIVFWRCLREFSHGMLSRLMITALFLLSVSKQSYFGFGAVAPSSYVQFGLILGQIRGSIGNVMRQYDEMIRCTPEVERFLELMDEKSSQKDGVHCLDDKKVRGEVVFENVTFSYPARPGQKAIDGLSVKIPANKVTAIVGDSGAGKTTMSKLIMRLYDPSQGRITLDGVDIRDIKLENLHEQVSIVNQNPALFNRSLLFNIRYGCKGRQDKCTFAQVQKASKIGNCSRFINSFRGRFNTAAGALGKQISGGQKQRIAIARVATRDPKVMILDEATSSLDAHNEHLVHSALERLMKGRTVIIIAHRLSTIQNADHIICLGEGGKIAEKGTHAELLAKRGTFFKLVQRQIFTTDDFSGPSDDGVATPA